MRKNLLTFMLGFSFLVLGMLVNTAEASNDVKPNIGKNQYQGMTSARSANLIKKFNKTNLKLREICNSSNTDCAFFIQLSADAFDSMIAACNYNETSSECANAQTWIEIVMEATLDACSMAKMVKKGEPLPLFNNSKLLKEIEAEE